MTADLPGAGPAERERADAWKDVTAALGRFQDLVIARELIDAIEPVGADSRADLAALLAGIDSLAARRLGEAQSALLVVS